MSYYRGDYYRGDPFLGALVGALAKPAIGIVKKAGGALIKAVGGKAAAGAIGGAVVSEVISNATSPPPVPQLPVPMNAFAPGGNLPGFKIPGTSTMLDPLHALPGGKPLTYTDPAAVAAQASGMRGYRPNKTGYWLKSGSYVYPGTKLVKSRRMNVGNARALRKAIRRGRGFAKLAKSVLSFVSARPPKGRAYFGKKRRGR